MTAASRSKNTSRRTSDKEPSDPDHRGEESRIPGRKLSTDQEARLMKVTGFSRAQLYNRRGWHCDHGVAVLLDSGDAIEEIHPTHVVIRTAEGTRQTLYNLEKETPFLKPASS